MPETAKRPINGFAKFDLHPNLMRGIQNAGFDEPRPIQAATLPAALEGADILGLAQTGTGKTAGFAIPILERIARDPGHGPTALILAPTRELASQIAEEVRTLASCTRIKGVTIYGGVGQRPQVASLRQRPDIIVACPGRLLDLIGQGFVKLGNFKKNPRKGQYAYLLTPKGIREKSLLTHSFIERKREEFEILKADIEALEEEAGLAAEATPAPRGGKQ